MKRHVLSAQSITYAGLFIALSIALTRAMSFYVTIGGVQGIRIGFGNIPIILSGVVLGPGLGAVVGAASDLIGSLIMPSGPYFPGFTISAALSGALPVIFFKLLSGNKSHLFVRIFMAVAISDIITSVGLDSLWIYILYHVPLAVLLLPRIIARVIMIPVTSYLIYTLLKYVPKLKGAI
jgi:ECF transporter S component (folate family)